MTSSNGDSNGSEPKGAKILDITDRLPPVVFGDNPAGRLAVKLLAVITNDEGSLHVHLAALMLVSHTLQRIMKEGFNVSEEEMQYSRERAYEITENMQVIIKAKEPG